MIGCPKECRPLQSINISLLCPVSLAIVPFEVSLQEMAYLLESFVLLGILGIYNVQFLVLEHRLHNQLLRVLIQAEQIGPPEGAFHLGSLFLLPLPHLSNRASYYHPFTRM
jgi:hypothetical protein